jgi:7-cyano-7-deazaguanine synthase in queuosine biosynthesis
MTPVEHMKAAFDEEYRLWTWEHHTATGWRILRGEDAVKTYQDRQESAWSEFTDMRAFASHRAALRAFAAAPATQNMLFWATMANSEGGFGSCEERCIEIARAYARAASFEGENGLFTPAVDLKAFAVIQPHSIEEAP